MYPHAGAGMSGGVAGFHGCGLKGEFFFGCRLKGEFFFGCGLKGEFFLLFMMFLGFRCF